MSKLHIGKVFAVLYVAWFLLRLPFLVDLVVAEQEYALVWFALTGLGFGVWASWTGWWSE